MMLTFSIHRSGAQTADKTFRDAKSYTCLCDGIPCTAYSAHNNPDGMITEAELDSTDTNLLADRILADMESIHGGTFVKEVI